MGFTQGFVRSVTFGETIPLYTDMLSFSIFLEVLQEPKSHGDFGDSIDILSSLDMDWASTKEMEISF